jgi:hypothetical protein
MRLSLQGDANWVMLPPLISATVCAGTHAIAQLSDCGCLYSGIQCLSASGQLYDAKPAKAPAHPCYGTATEQAHSVAPLERDSHNWQHGDSNNDRVQQSSGLAGHGPVSQLLEVQTNACLLHGTALHVAMALTWKWHASLSKTAKDT